MNYNRNAALNYTKKWAYSRNPLYYNFDNLGGDCTNFISQCIYSGCNVMNFIPVYGWYYISLSRRTPSWTGVEYLYRFLISNNSAGPFAEISNISDVMPADIIQLKRENSFTHSLIITKIEPPLNIFVSTHTYDCYDRPLTNYIYDDIRYLHIKGARN